MKVNFKFSIYQLRVLHEFHTKKIFMTNDSLKQHSIRYDCVSTNEEF